MAIVAKPREYESSTETLGFYTGYPRYKRSSYTKQRYVDTEYEMRNTLGIAPLKMPYFLSDSTSEEGTYKYTWKNSSNPTREYPINMTAYRDASITESDGWSRAAEKFYGNCADVNEVNLGVAMAEARQTFGLVATTAIRLKNAYSTLRKGEINKAFKHLGISDDKIIPYPVNGLNGMTARRHRKIALRRVSKLRTKKQYAVQAASTWLEMRYGWMPLLYDIHGSIELVDRLLNESDSDLIVSGVFVNEDTEFKPASSSFDVTSSESLRVWRYDIDFKLRNPYLRNLNSMGLLNPATVGWEVVPFSFVVDWFLPIGNWLDSFTAMTGWDVTQGSKSYFERFTYQVEHKTIEDATSIIEGAIPSSHESVYLVRDKVVSMPSIPLPRFSLYERLNGERVTDSISLLAQRFLGSKPSIK